MATKATIFKKDCTPRFHATIANEKLGGKGAKIMAVGYVPGSNLIYFKDSNRPISDCKGTCSAVDCKECVKHCYAVRSYRQYPNKTINCVENTLQLRKDITKHFSDIRNYARYNGVNIIRYTESGEIESFSQFEHLVNLALSLPNVFVYAYTKNFDVLRKFFFLGYELPKNLTVLISIWEALGVNEYNEFKEHKNIKAFAVNPPSDFKPSVFCPAYVRDEKTGKVKRSQNPSHNCARCGLCFNSKAKIIGCLEH